MCSRAISMKASASRAFRPGGLEFLREICGMSRIPVYAIGGIRRDAGQIREILDCGGRRRLHSVGHDAGIRKGLLTHKSMTFSKSGLYGKSPFFVPGGTLITERDDYRHHGGTDDAVQHGVHHRLLIGVAESAWEGWYPRWWPRPERCRCRRCSGLERKGIIKKAPISRMRLLRKAMLPRLAPARLPMVTPARLYQPMPPAMETD